MALQLIDCKGNWQRKLGARVKCFTIRIGEPVEASTFETRDRLVDLMIYGSIGIHDKNIFRFYV
jgi:hypothetical protein